MSTKTQFKQITSGSRDFGEGGPRSIKYKSPHSAAMFSAYFTVQGGGMAPLAPPLDALLSH